MNKNIKILSFLVISIILSCSKESPLIKENNINRNKSKGKLDGCWKLVKYLNSKDSILFSEPYDKWSSIILYFKDNKDTGYFVGHTETNDVGGLYKFGSDSIFNVTCFGGTKVGEPKWGHKFWNTILKSNFYYLDSSTLKIYYEDKNYMLFEKSDQIGIFYRDQTRCSEPWHTSDSTSNSVTIDSIQFYIYKSQTNFYNIDFTFESDIDTICKSCFCGTGKRINVIADTNDSIVFKNLGFKLIIK